MNSGLYKNFLWFGIALFLIFTPLPRGAVQVWSFVPVMGIIFFLVFVWLWRLNNYKDHKLQPTPLDLPIILFFLLAIVSSIFSMHKHDSAYALLKLFSYIGLFYLIVNNFDYCMIRRMIVLTICIGTALSLYGLLQYFGIFPHDWWRKNHLLASTYANHNHFSGYLELVMPVTLGVLLKSGKDNLFARVFLMGALMVMMVALIFAQSRGAWICLAVAFCVMSIILVKRSNIAKTTALISLLLLVFIFSYIYLSNPKISERLDTIVEVQVEEDSFQARLSVWQSSVKMIKQHPLVGTGIGAFRWGFSRFRPEKLATVGVRFAHNDYLHMAVEMGVLAPLIMFLIFIMVIRTGLTIANYHLDILGCCVGVLSLALHGLVDFNFHIPANMLLVVAYAAFIMNKSYLGQGKSVHGESDIKKSI
ncbi:MAG: O-antigen ligase family protein [Candidatus Omnitrophota bacterium]|nr:MAG: O-antigen ligase family protein [Candidatus Omnitrophota bacterium]